MHHRAVHRAGDERTWWKQTSIDPLKIARKLWKHTRVNEGRIRRPGHRSGRYRADVKYRILPGRPRYSERYAAPSDRGECRSFSYGDGCRVCGLLSEGKRETCPFGASASDGGKSSVPPGSWPRAKDARILGGPPIPSAKGLPRNSFLW